MDVFGGFHRSLDSAGNQQKARELDRSGLAQIESGNLRQAKADFHKATGLCPEDAVIRGHLAVALLQLGDLNDAYKEAQQAVKNSPLNVNSHHACGQVLEAMERLGAAVKEYTQAAKLDSTKAQSLAALAGLGLRRRIGQQRIPTFEEHSRDGNEPQSGQS